MARFLAVVGTDTGVGKTLVAAALGLALRGRGVRVGYVKPASSGCIPRAGGLVSGDAERVRRALAIRADPSVLAPVRYRAPLAPWVASWREGNRFSWRSVRDALRRAGRGADAVLVEGVGGALVPITEHATFADLCARFSLPACVVARAGLGTINHTLLTVEALRRRGIRVRAVILNGARGRDPAERGNPRAIARLAGAPVLAVLPRIRSPWSAGGLASLGRRFDRRALRLLGLA